MSERNSTVGELVHALLSGERLGKFLSVGVVGALVDIVVLLALVEAGLLEELATLAGIEASLLVMFALNERWTFAGKGRQEVGALFHRIWRSHVVRSTAIVVQFVVFVALFRLVSVSATVGGLDLWLLAAKGAGIVAGLGLNYVCESLFTWRVQRKGQNKQE